MKNKILFSKQLLHPFFYVIPMYLGTYSIFDLFVFEDKTVLFKIIPSLFFTYLLHSLLNITKSVILKNDKLTKGIHILGIGFVKKEFEISKAVIYKVYIEQKKDKYFGIYIQTKTGINYELSALPNRFPAIEKSKEIEKILLKTV